MRLQFLDLDHNEMPSMPNSIFHPLTSLQELRLHSNALNGLQSTHFSTLGSLKSLFLNNNRLSVRAWGAHRTTQLPSWEVDRLPVL